MKPIATPEQFNQIAGEAQAIPLNYPSFLDSELCRRQQAAAGRRHEATRYRKRQRIKNRIMTGAWALTTIGMGVALIVWG